MASGLISSRWVGAAIVAVPLLLAGCGHAPTATSPRIDPPGPYRVVTPVGGNGEATSPPARSTPTRQRYSGPESLKVTILLRNGAVTSAPLTDQLKSRAMALVTRMNSLDGAHKRALTAEIYHELANDTLDQVSLLMKRWAKDPAEAIDFLDRALTASSAMSQHDVDTALANLPEDVDIGYQVEVSPPES